MKKNLSIVRMMLAAIVFSTCAPSLKAQSGVVVNVGADLVSGYVWRGVYQIGSGASVQPSLGLAYKGFSIGAWGSTSLREGFRAGSFGRLFGRRFFRSGHRLLVGRTGRSFLFRLSEYAPV
ncbi:MAG: TorF family putative porin [Alistipes sp.]